MKTVKESGILRAPAENSISGIAVMAPEKINQNEELLYPNVRLPCCHIYHKYIIPAGAVTIHSIVILLIASIGTIFLIRTYIPNEKATSNEMPGNTPTLIVIYNTPITANPIAIHSNLLKRSFKNINASKILTSGLM